MPDDDQTTNGEMTREEMSARSFEAGAGTMTPEQLRAAATASVGLASAALADIGEGQRTEPHENHAAAGREPEDVLPGHGRVAAQAQGRRHQGGRRHQFRRARR